MKGTLTHGGAERLVTRASVEWRCSLRQTDRQEGSWRLTPQFCYFSSSAFDLNLYRMLPSNIQGRLLQFLFYRNKLICWKWWWERYNELPHAFVCPDHAQGLVFNRCFKKPEAPQPSFPLPTSKTAVGKKASVWKHLSLAFTVNFSRSNWDQTVVYSLTSDCSLLDLNREHVHHPPWMKAVVSDWTAQKIHLLLFSSRSKELQEKGRS